MKKVAKKPPVRIARFGSLAAVMGAGMLVPSALGDSLYWGSGGINTSWTTASNWFADAAETIPGTVPTLLDDLYFNTTPDNTVGGNVTISAAVEARSLTFNTSATTTLAQSGNRVLTLGAGGITLNSGAGAANVGVSTNSLSVQMTASQTWTNNSTNGLSVRSPRVSDLASGPVTLTLNAANSGNITFALSSQDSPDTTKPLSVVVDSAGTGTVSMAGSTYTGGTSLSRGILAISGTLGTGGITLGVTDSANDARLNATGVVNNNITVTSGSGLRALTGSGSGDFAGNITLQNNVSIGAVSSSGQTIAVNGDISGAHSLIIGRVATGTSSPTVTLGGDNTFTGKTSVTSATLVVSSLNSVVGGTASSNLGAPVTVENGTIVMSAVAGSTLRYVGTGETTDRVIEIASSSGATLDQSGTGLLKFTSNLAHSGTGSRTLTLRGATAGTGEISGAIANNGASSTGITKNDSGTWRLSGLNSYTGTTSIAGGVLEVVVLANTTENSSIGAGSLVNLTFSGGTLRYVGSGHSTNRLFTIGAAGATLDASGTGAVNFTATSSPSYGTAGSSPTLTLTGTNTGENTLAALINNTGAGKTALLKSGTGRWILSANNTYAGSTTITGGRLVVSGKLASPDVIVETPALGDQTVLELGNNASLADSAKLTLNTGAILDLGFTTGNEQVGQLLIGGTLFNSPIVFNADNNYNGYATYFTSDGGGLEVVPEPASLSLIGLGGLALLKRRRRTVKA